jgi:hypothetical protein
MHYDFKQQWKEHAKIESEPSKQDGTVQYVSWKSRAIGAGGSKWSSLSEDESNCVVHADRSEHRVRGR